MTKSLICFALMLANLVHTQKAYGGPGNVVPTVDGMHEIAPPTEPGSGIPTLPGGGAIPNGPFTDHGAQAGGNGYVTMPEPASAPHNPPISATPMMPPVVTPPPAAPFSMPPATFPEAPQFIQPQEPVWQAMHPGVPTTTGPTALDTAALYAAYLYQQELEHQKKDFARQKKMLGAFEHIDSMSTSSAEAGAQYATQVKQQIRDFKEQSAQDMRHGTDQATAEIEGMIGSAQASNRAELRDIRTRLERLRERTLTRRSAGTSTAPRTTGTNQRQGSVPRTSMPASSTSRPAVAPDQDQVPVTVQREQLLGDIAVKVVEAYELRASIETNLPRVTAQMEQEAAELIRAQMDASQRIIEVAQMRAETAPEGLFRSLKFSVNFATATLNAINQYVAGVLTGIYQQTTHVTYSAIDVATAIAQDPSVVRITITEAFDAWGRVVHNSLHHITDPSELLHHWNSVMGGVLKFVTCDQFPVKLREKFADVGVAIQAFGRQFITEMRDRPYDLGRIAGGEVADLALVAAAVEAGGPVLRSLGAARQDARAAKIMDSTGVGTIATDSPFNLNRTHRLQPRNLERVREMIQKDGGIRETIKYVEHEGRKYIVDGNHRARAAMELGLQEVPVERVELPYRGYRTIDDVLNR